MLQKQRNNYPSTIYTQPHDRIALLVRTQTKVITVYVNGAARELTDGCSIAMLIDELGYSGRRIAIECNGDIVPRSLYAERILHDGGKLEIVVAVGGG